MRKHFFFILTILLLGILPYSRTFRGAFVFDDITGIVQKEAIHDLGDIHAVWDANHSRFLTNLSFAVNYHFGGLRVEGYHIVNSLIHLINGVLVYWFVFLLSERKRHFRLFSLIVALLFVSHPIQTQAVAYISQRTTSLAALWYLLSLNLWLVVLSDPLKRKKYLVLSYLFAVFAFLTKEYTYTLPLTAIMLMFFMLKKQVGVSLRFAAAGLLLCAILTYLFARTTIFQNPSGAAGSILSVPTYAEPGISRWEFFISEMPVVVTYIRLLLVPVGQSADHDVPVYRSVADPVVAASFALLAALCMLAVYVRRYNPVVSLGALFFFLTLSAESTVIPISDLMMEHRLYLPSVGFFLAMAECLRWVFQKMAIRLHLYYAFMMVLILVSMVLTVRRNAVWQNGIDLWSDVVAKSPQKARGHFNLGGALISGGYRAEGIDELIVAQHLDPSYKKAVLAVFALLQHGQQP